MVRHHLIKTVGILSILLVWNVQGELSAPKESPLSLRLIDVETNISPINVLFLNKKASIIVDGLEWLSQNQEISETSERSLLSYSTYINEQQTANGSIDFSVSSNNTSAVYFPTSIDAGVIEAKDSGVNSIRVLIHHLLDDEIIELSATLDVRSYRPEMASIPIALSFGLFLVFNIHMVHSLFLAIFIGSWIIEGSMTRGFKATFDTFLLEAATDNDHVSIILFIVGIFGLMAMVNRSGGTSAVIKSLTQHSSKTRLAQFVIFLMGLAFFFNPYVSIMIVGNIIGSIFKSFPLSSEKVSFLIDTTAAPVASIFPTSSWVVFSTDLIEREIEKIKALGYEEVSGVSGHSLIISSIMYQFYPIFVLGLAVLQILTGREMGLVLDAENKARLSYNSIDPRKTSFSRLKERSLNWYIPVVTLNVFLWYAFSQDDNESTEAFGTTWLMNTVAAIIITQLFFVFQRRDGKVPFLSKCFDRYERDTIAYLTDTFPSASGSASIHYNPSSKSEDEENYLKALDDDCQMILQMNTEEEENGRKEKSWLVCSTEPSLLTFHDGAKCMVQSAVRAAPIALSLVLTWAAGSVYQALGIDRVVISWIVSDTISVEILPITIFLSTFFLSITLGSSMTTISILLPTIMTPLVDSLGGDSKGMSLVLASILSGAAAGDHIGPFSETTIISALVSGITVRRHFITQAPYALFVLVMSLLVGTLPVSYGSYPAYVGYIIGVVVLLLFVILVCRQVKRYKSSIGGPSPPMPVSEVLHPMIAPQEKRREDRSATPMHPGTDNQQQQPRTNEPLDGTDVVEGRESFKSKLQTINDAGGDPIKGLVEDGILPNNFVNFLQKPPLGQGAPERNAPLDSAKESKKRLIEATIKKAEQDGNVFSDSLRTFLRTAQENLGNMLDDNRNQGISASASTESGGDDDDDDDSLDNLMMNIAAKGWRASINNILGDAKNKDDYSTDGGSSMMESDESAFTSASSRSGPSHFSTGTSQLLNPLEFNNDDFSSVPDEEQTAIASF